MDEKIRLLNSENDSIKLDVINNINNNNLLLNNILSNDILKTVFTYLKYNYILKLIKKNKSLQNQLGFDIQNYKDYSDIKYESIEKKKVYKGYIKGNGFLSPVKQLLFLLYLFLLLVTCYAIYVNIEQKKLNNPSINKVNYSLFVLILFSCIFSSFLKESIHTYLALFFISINIFYEILIAVKMYKIAEIWGPDLFFQIINLAYIIFNCIYIKEFWPQTEKEITHKLLSYKNIQIKPYIIENFKDFINHQKKYVSSITKFLLYNYSIEDLKIVNQINNLREKNNLTKVDKNYNLPDYIINKISEIFLFNSSHLFKLDNNKYLLKIELGKFNHYFKNDNEGMINILLKQDINTINIITQGNMQYILLYYSDSDYL